MASKRMPSCSRFHALLFFASVLGCSGQEAGGSASASESSSGADSMATTGASEGSVSTTGSTSGTPTTGATTGGSSSTHATGGSSSAGETSTSTGMVETGGPSSSSGGSGTDGSTSSSTGGNELCTEWIVHQGDLVITDNTDLASLTCIVEVTGRLLIKHTKTLTSFPQLGNLHTVGEKIAIGDNAALTDVDGLAGLVQVTGLQGPLYVGELTLYQNPALVDISGLHSLKIVDAIMITDCDALTSLAGIEGPIVGNKQKGWRLALGGLDALESLDSLGALENFSYALDIRDCPKLTDISALEFVLDPDGVFHLIFVDNPALIDLVGLEAIAHATEVHIWNNDSLKDLTGLDGLQDTTANFLILDNDELLGLHGLKLLDQVHYLAIENNPKLVDLSGIDSLKTATLGISVGYCATGGNNALIDLHGLETVETIKGLGVDNNANLKSLVGLEGLKNLEFLFVRNNPGVSSAEANALAAKHGAVPQICNNAGPPEDCPCIPWME